MSGMVKPVSTKRPPPAVDVPHAIRNTGGVPTQRGRQLQMMLTDLGYFKGRITGYAEGNDTRSAVSQLQQQLIRNGSYDGVPHGRFDEATRAATLADESIPTREL